MSGQRLLPEEIMQKINVAQINVLVPDSLTVAEANWYYPGSDIVWGEDPIGDRHAQVAHILQDALGAGSRRFRVRSRSPLMSRSSGFTR